VDRDQILDLFDDMADEISQALPGLADWGLSGERATQYHHDVLADEIIVSRLLAAGFSVLSEESGLINTGGPLTVVVDPIDGSTNASRGLPWFGTSLCAVDEQGPVVALVANLADGRRYRAQEGEGFDVTDPGRNDIVEPDTTPDGMSETSPETTLGRRHRFDPGGFGPSGCHDLTQAILGFSGLPPDHGGWAQFRALGAAALDMCAVATGRLDGFIDLDRAHGVWDYLGALLVCDEAGVAVAETAGEELVVLDPAARRGPVVAATETLLDSMLDMIRRWSV